jgi:hypothetical protein
MGQNWRSELLWMIFELSMTVTMKIAILSRDTVQFGKNYSI